MRRRLITAGFVLGGLVLAACGSAGPGVQARQAGDATTTTAAAPETTIPPAPDTTTPATTAPPVNAAVAEAPCTPEALGAAYAAKYGSEPGAGFKVQKCVEGWATSAQAKGFNPPVFALYQAEGDHWVALNRSGGKLCEGYGVPAEIAPQIGCDT
jgi:predicted small secreted protein